MYLYKIACPRMMKLDGNIDRLKSFPHNILEHAFLELHKRKVFTIPPTFSPPKKTRKRILVPMTTSVHIALLSIFPKPKLMGVSRLVKRIVQLTKTLTNFYLTKFT